MTTKWLFNKEIPAQGPESPYTIGNDLSNAIPVMPYRPPIPVFEPESP